MRTVDFVRTHDEHDIPIAGVYTIDPAHSSVEFIARHLAITKVRGRFREVSGTITIDEEPERSRVEAEINVASIDTGNTDRDNHLRSGDFFDATNHPTMSFTSTSVARSGAASWFVTGDLTVHDVTRPVTFRVGFDGASTSPTGDKRISFSAAAEVDREDWGLTWNMALETGGLLVSKKVRIELNIQAVAVS